MWNQIPYFSDFWCISTTFFAVVLYDFFVSLDLV
jgi:hypothetical protein